MNHSPSVHPFLLCVVAVVIAVQSGCVAMNIPSQRFHDAGDQGGVLGSWENGSIDPIATQMMHGHGSCHEPVSGIQHASDYIGGGELDVDPFDASVGEHGKPKEPEVPWPRFHPVPTRPLFRG